MANDDYMRDQAQRARRYSYAQHGRQQKGLMGDHLLKRGCGVQTYKPSWKAPTTLRIFPALCPENPEVFDPWRLSPEGDEYGDWIRTYPAVRNFGDPGVTMILFDPTDRGYDPQLNPCWMLYTAVKEAMRAGHAQGHWVPLTQGSAGRGAALSRPGEISLVQGAAMQHNGKVFDQPKGGLIDDPTIVWELPPSAVSAMLTEMNETNPEFRGDPTDYANKYKFGDPVSLDGGAFVTLFQIGQDPRERMQANPVRRGSGFGQASPRQQHGGAQQDDNRKGYGCYLEREFGEALGVRGGMPATLVHCEDMVRRKWKPWDSIIEILPHEEQVRLLSGAFPADMIVYALQDAYRDFIPEDTWRKYRGAHTYGPGPQEQPPQEAPVTQPAPQQTPPRAGERRGFGSSSPVNGERTLGETAPRTTLPRETGEAPTQGQPVPQQGRSAFDAPPAQTTTESAPAGRSVLDEIAASRERLARRRSNRQQPTG